MRADIVLSIDFELRWGVQDKLGDDFTAYRRNLEGVADVVPGTLEVFERCGARATWATVGAVACEGWDEWADRAPPSPLYLDPKLRWRDAYRKGDPEGRLYFAPRLVELVRAADGQELGSHTFSHVYLGEPGLVRRDAEADTASVVELFRQKWNAAPTSFVFPRNQVGFVDVLREHGFDTWRENPEAFYWSLTSSAQDASVVRLLRLADGLLPMGTRSFRRDAAVHRASHFVRFGLSSLAWKAHMRRLVDEARALRPGGVLHLWWHPHNLGADVSRSLARLTTLLDALRANAPSYVRFANMNDVTRLGRGSPAVH